MTFAVLMPAFRPSVRTHLDPGVWTAGIRSGAGAALIVGECSLAARGGGHAATPVGRSSRPVRVVGRRIAADDVVAGVVDLPGEVAAGSQRAIAGSGAYPHGRGGGCHPVRRPPIVTVRVDLMRPPARRDADGPARSRRQRGAGSGAR
jgi:hypothetical protein